MNESTFGEYFCDCLVKDLPYCIIVFVFFRCLGCVHQRKHIIASLFFCVSLLKEILSVFVIGILSDTDVNIEKHIVAFAPLIVFLIERKLNMCYLVLILDRRKHTIICLLFFYFLIEGNQCIVVYGMYGFQIGILILIKNIFQLLKLYILYTTIHQK